MPHQIAPETRREIEPAASPAGSADTAKRRQIMDGARRVFMRDGFDGASMGDIVVAAGVSKATVYAYFESKEKLFETLIFEERRTQAEQLFALDPDDHDARAALTRLGTSFMTLMTRPDTVQLTRVVIAAAVKFPRIGRAFYEAGPEYGKQRLKAYLEAQVLAGVLDIADLELAAVQFLDLCKSGITVPMLLGVLSAAPKPVYLPTVESAVAVFLAAYGRR